MKILDLYIGRHVMQSTLVVFAVLLGLFVFVTFVDELGDMGTGQYGVIQVLQYVILSIPMIVYDLFPMAALLYAVSCAHCTPVSLGQGGIGLGTMWGWETAQSMLEEAGFRQIERHVLPHDPMNVWFVSRA